MSAIEPVDNDQLGEDEQEQEQDPDTPLSLPELPCKVDDGRTGEEAYTNGTPQPNGTLDSASDQHTVAAASEPIGQEGLSRDELPPENPVNDLLDSPVLRQEEADTTLEDTEVRLDSLEMERDALQNEVAQLRKSLEELQGKHEEELSDVKNKLEETQGDKDQAETQYRNLLVKVNTIKSQLGERLKADAVCSKAPHKADSSCLSGARKIFHKLEDGLKSLKNSVEVYVNRTRLAQLSWRL